MLLIFHHETERLDNIRCEERNNFLFVSILNDFFISWLMVQSFTESLAINLKDAAVVIINKELEEISAHFNLIFELEVPHFFQSIV